MLTKPGIRSLAKLEARGAVGAYLAVKRIRKGASLNLRWALEGALTGRPWQDVARESVKKSRRRRKNTT